jgi:AbrB family looped-hinge helix DNA binding protein
MKKPAFYGSTIISDKGQVVIPVEARTALNLEKGEKLLVIGMHGDSIMLTKLSSFKRMSEELAARQKEIDKVLKEI